MIKKYAVLCPAAVFGPCNLPTAAGRGIFVRHLPEQVRGDGQGFGTGDASVDTPNRTVAVYLAII
jgi:hypothetical protein